MGDTVNPSYWDAQSVADAQNSLAQENDRRYLRDGVLYALRRGHQAEAIEQGAKVVFDLCQSDPGGKRQDRVKNFAYTPITV